MTRVISLPTAPAAVPSLDDVAADPARAATLPPPTLHALLCRCATVQTALLGALLTASAQPADGAHRSATDGADRLLTTRDVAERVGMSVSWVEKHTADLPPRVTVAGNPRWRKSDLDRWLRNRPEHAIRA